MTLSKAKVLDAPLQIKEVTFRTKDTDVKSKGVEDKIMETTAKSKEYPSPKTKAWPRTLFSSCSAYVSSFCYKFVFVAFLISSSIM